ncbi:hypothetical protein AVEN_212321-1 [Araneus ventricosus]|uniref:Uncharacterized protein n=1 Tax=Araneus ventricosus TaxID=182803 RepID=A0A4Y2IC62_ARAVE|nr:hypothetical protein AVEN_212321-1 [Araneus ventricosus]
MKPISRNHPLKIGAQLLRKVLHRLYASLMSMFESDVRIVLTSKGKIGAVGRVIQCLPSEAKNVFICVPRCVVSCVIVEEQNPSTQEPWSGPTAPSDFHLFPAFKSALRTPLCASMCGCH